jgi:hypothetical protein
MGDKRSSRTGRAFARRLCALQLAIGLAATTQLALASDPSQPASANDRDQAKESFNRGLLLARSKDYRAAIAAFEHAYQLAPHHMALWNIARSHIALQENDQGVRFLRRYLSEGGTAISPEQRAQVEAEIAELQTNDSAEPNGQQPARQPPQLRLLGAPAGATFSLNGTPWLEGDPLVPGTSELTINQPGYLPWSQPVELTPGITTTVQVVMTPDSPPAPIAPTAPDDGATLNEREHPTLSYVLAGVGAGVLVGSAGLYLWNDGRYDDWRKEDTDLQRLIASEGASTATNSRQTTNNELLESVETVDVLAVVGGIVGLGLVGTGVYLYFSDSTPKSNGPATSLVIGPRSLQLHGTW